MMGGMAGRSIGMWTLRRLQADARVAVHASARSPSVRSRAAWLYDHLRRIAFELVSNEADPPRHIPNLHASRPCRSAASILSEGHRPLGHSTVVHRPSIGRDRRLWTACDRSRGIASGSADEVWDSAPRRLVTAVAVVVRARARARVAVSVTSTIGITIGF
jgi:hypothetical protein